MRPRDLETQLLLALTYAFALYLVGQFCLGLGALFLETLP